MTSEKPRYRPPTGSNAEEKRAWASFYARVGKESTLAAEVVAQLDKDSELKRAHLALYLSCRESLRTQSAREARNQRIAQAVRWLFHVLFAVPAKLLVGGLSRGTDIALASLPQEAKREPAVRQVRRIARSKTFSADKAQFDQQSKQQTG
ncbi:hypothetical protein [Xanthomonas hortorum]|uniref:Uncharacterized protein n=1 Tax=Xanthomonas hortorum pv. hederae TaxID=453603 RepID=A0A9X4BSE0_9XANT|nr:hypothetical protein [Xanthomonas hortorum]MCE4369723.1 hypothetical protein [Xanthomonas hortorum pv. hederae]MDC8638737.1 hypothetical protein [Xanthomonas hortorum pv. hederae]PPU86257.1 hypothetical protein XhhCFBP4925_00575 [Xanthomonas hortorum pv. hederae]PUF01384.1 hypothetical protein C7T87_03445 [Xanthomonas hortorum pv. hederae]